MPQVALLLGYSLVFWLVRSDRKRRKLTSAALWIPALWLTVLGSRSPSFWLGSGGQSNLEGSPINSLFNGALIVGSILVLRSRRFDWAQFVRSNKALVLIYSYFLASALWSEIPLPTFKRLFNDAGNFLVPLVILTEHDPAAAIKTVYTRIAFLLLPMSVVAIRFFPLIGRQFDRSGNPMLTGVTGHKNSLGALAMMLSLVILWDLLQESRKEGGSFFAVRRWPSFVALAFGIYLLIVSHSATALGCFILGVGLQFVIPRLERFRNATQLMVAAALLVVCFFVLDAAVGVTGEVYKLLGRTESLSGRTEIWEVISQREVNALLGAGFRGFWESKGGETIYQQLNMNRLLTAHNGYLEVYLNGGAVGVTLLVIMLLATGRSAMNRVTNRDALGRISIVFWVISLINNNTESVFFIGDPLWFTQLLFTLDCPKPQNLSVGAKRVAPHNELVANLSPRSGK